MRKIAFSMIVLALTIPAMADVTITLDNNSNVVTIGYDCNEGEVVRAFALDVDVNDSAFVIGSADLAGDPNFADYYIHPAIMTLMVVDGNIVIDDYGIPIAEQDTNGDTLEIDSLYAASDSNHSSLSAASGDLCTFAVDCNDHECVLVTIAGESSRRVVVVSEETNSVFALGQPETLDDPCDCQCYGDITGDNMVRSDDVITLAGWLNTYGVYVDRKKIIPITDHEHYDPCAEVNGDGKITAADVVTIASWLNTYGVLIDKKKTIMCPHPHGP